MRENSTTIVLNVKKSDIIKLVKLFKRHPINYYWHSVYVFRMCLLVGFLLGSSDQMSRVSQHPVFFFIPLGLKNNFKI